MWQVLKSDVDAVRRAQGRLLPWLYPAVLAVALYRVSAWVHPRSRVLARAVQALNEFLTGAEIDPLAQIGPGLQLRHTNGVVIGTRAVAGRDLVLYGQTLLGSAFGESPSNPRYGFPVLGDGVMMLAKASVIGPVHVGDGAIIGAHALVVSDVPARAVARGVPARNYARDGSPSLEATPR